jgi:hypothetical protein
VFEKRVKGKVALIQAVEALRIARGRGSHIFTDGGKVVSPTRWPLFNPRNIPGTHFC